MVLFGDYAFADSTAAVFPNRLLRERGFLQTRQVGKRHYPDFHYSRAFAVVDHEIAHVYVRIQGRRAGRGGNGRSGRGGRSADRDATRLGAWAIARAGRWCSSRRREPGSPIPGGRAGEAPDYATHMDIHNKPGYDPCELFFGWPPFTVSTNTANKRLTRPVGPGRQIAWAATCPIEPGCGHLIGLAAALKERIVIRNS